MSYFLYMITDYGTYLQPCCFYIFPDITGLCKIVCYFYTTKKFITISLLALYLFCATEACQLLKLPVLISHFLEHQKINKSISFVEYLDLHYDNNPDTQEHQEGLPFKSVDICCIAGHSTLPFIELEIDLPCYNYLVKEFPQYRHLGYQLLKSQDIFQPPRTA